MQKKVEPSIIAHGQNKGPKPPGWQRPFLETPSARREPIREHLERTVEFPEKDESTGEILINYMGPSMDNLLESKACILHPIMLAFTHRDPGNRNSWHIPHVFSHCTAQQRVHRNRISSLVCLGLLPFLRTALTGYSTFIYIWEDARATNSDITIYVGSVPTEHLDTFDVKLHESFRRIVKEGVHMDRMSMVIDREERQVLFRPRMLFATFLIDPKFRSKLESDGGDAFSATMIDDFLYGRLDGSQIEEALDEIKLHSTLRTWSNTQWTNLIQKCVQFLQHLFTSI